ncbi:MAG: exodeoxyribonuclease VII large subunit [Betaproteobacteria bacterium]|nr:exodeoxyribonuclease VII large subunit [Betaproteobacteria bacterium]
MLDFSISPAAQPVISVSELNRLAKDLLEGNLPLMWIGGEISNFKRYDSGHCYFTLKDAQAQVECVIFRHKIQYLDWLPDNGMQVEVRACPTLYEARGKFQLNVETMRRSGLGALFEAFAKLKARFEREGLFDPARKKPLPAFPRTIGIITSIQAAALRDVLTTLRRRMPSLPVIVYPTPVQGEGAGQKVAAAIEIAAARAECDVLIVCRGGGSLEDLWAFNEEIVARAIHACTIPIVTGIGHETDFTIADFVADARGPTPTAAAALATPDRVELRQQLLHWYRHLGRVTMRTLEERMQRLDYLGKRLIHPGERIRGRTEALQHLATRMRGAWQRASQEHAWRVRELGRWLSAARPDLETLQRQNDERARRLQQAASRRLEAAAAVVDRVETHLKHLNPQLVLERGYSITATGGGRIVRDSAQVACGEELTITFARGWAGAQVKRKG